MSLAMATVPELIEELVKRSNSLVLALYRSEDGDGIDCQNLDMRAHGFLHEQAGLSRMISLHLDKKLQAHTNRFEVQKDNEDA